MLLIAFSLKLQTTFEEGKLKFKLSLVAASFAFALLLVCFDGRGISGKYQQLAD